MKSCEIVSLVTAAACTIANCVPKDDLPLITGVLGQLTATLANINIQEKALAPEQKTPEVVPDTVLISEESNSVL